MGFEGSNPMRPKNVLMIKTGEAAPSIRLTAGDYDRWFASAIGHQAARFHLCHVWLGEALPTDVRQYDAIIVTGSPLSATRPTDWMKRTGELMVNAAEKRVPTLGVCFGHQLLGMACGVSVIKNPKGREIGTVEVALTEDGRKDPLFEGVPARFPIQATHQDIVPALPAGATLLASNEAAAVQSMAVGPYLRGVQFHPEASTEGIKAIIQSRVELIDQEGQAEGEPFRARRILEGVRPAPYGPRILANFLERFTA
jgi:GMP synthase (glutamine-hydrolysing)